MGSLAIRRGLHAGAAVALAAFGLVAIAGAFKPSTLVGIGPTERPTPPPSPACTESLGLLVSKAAPGTTVTVPGCLAREVVTIDKPLTLIGRPGAQIRGSDVWRDWIRSGDTWVSEEQVPEFTTHGYCMSGDACLHAEQVFLDGLPLRRVTARPGVGAFAMDASRHVVLGDDPSNHMVEVTTRDAWVIIAARFVTIEGFSMAHAANDAQSGAIRNVNGAGDDTVRDSVLAYAHGADVALDFGSGNDIEGNDIGYGGQLGVHLGGDGTSGDGHSNVVRDNTIHDNNLARFDPEWEAGGLKATRQTSLVIDGNEVASNGGPGIWCDIYCSGVEVTRNRVHDNSHAGIFYEVSTSGAIAGNSVWRNGFGKRRWGWGAGILLSSSGQTVVEDNTVAWNATSGISVISQRRLDWPNVEATGIVVVSNTVAGVAGSWLAFWDQDWDGPLFDAASGNRGSLNRYWAGPRLERHSNFRWGTDLDSLAAFNATAGEDQGRFLTDDELDAALEAAGIPVTP